MPHKSPEKNHAKAHERHRRIPKELPVVQLIPNVLTVMAICAGLSAIRFGVQGNYELATQLVLAAGILDGLDGRLARMLGSDSKMGAELDSLADFVNFGVAPPLVIYFWALQDMRSAGWISVLVFAVCCVLRLARFNVSHKSEAENDESGYYEGVPAPAGALLVMMPMFLSFAIADRPVIPAPLIAIYMTGIGLLLISHIPTWSFKAMTISRENVKFLLVGLAFVVAAVLTYAWITLVALGVAYISVALMTLLTGKTPTKLKTPEDPAPDDQPHP